MGRVNGLKKNWYVGAACLLAVILGYWLTFVFPARIAQKELNFAITTLQEMSAKDEDLQGRIDNDKWINPVFLEKQRALLTNGKEAMVKAQDDISRAKNAGTFEKNSLASEARELLGPKKGAAFFYEKIETSFKEADDLAANSSQELGLFRTEAQKTDAELARLKEKLNKAERQYLSKYVMAMSKLLENGKGNLTDTETYLSSVSKLLPPKTDQTSTADPYKAAEILVSAKASLKEAVKNLSQFTTELELQATAEKEAASKTTLAVTKHMTVDQKLTATAERTKLSLKKALAGVSEKLRVANNLIDTAHNALSVMVEDGKYDMLLAYKSALSAISALDEADKGIDEQENLLRQSREQYDSLATQIALFEDKLASSKKYDTTLRQNHNRDAWSGYINIYQEGSNKIVNARLLLSAAKSDFQEREAFKAGLEKLDKGIKSLNDAESSVDELKSVCLRLEGFRESWPNEKKRTKDLLDDEDGDVSNYGEYSSSAKSDYDDAVYLYKEAVAAASDRMYEMAVEKAEKAYNLAEGTGARALDAYEDYQDEQKKLADAQRDSDESDDDSGGGSTFSFSGESGGDSGDGNIFDSSPNDGGFVEKSGANDGGGWN